MRMRTAAVAFSGFVVLGLPTGMLGIAWPSIRAALDAPLAGLGVLLAAMTLTQFGSSGLSGVIRERLGTTALLVVPTALAAGGLAVFAVADSWPAIIAAAAVLGAGLGLLDAAVNMEAALKRGVRFMGALHASCPSPSIPWSRTSSTRWNAASTTAGASSARHAHHSRS